MAQNPSGRVAEARPAERLSPSAAEMKAAIRETRSRLAVNLAQTANHVHLLFTAPSTIETESPAGGVIAHAVTTIVAASRAQRAWTAAMTTGLLRRAAVAGVAVAIAGALAARKHRR